LTRIQEEKESEQLKRNPVDYNAAARLAYESSTKVEDFESFLSNYLVSTSAWIAQKSRDRETAKKLEEEQMRLLQVEEDVKQVEEEAANSLAEQDDMDVTSDAERIMMDEEMRLVNDQQTAIVQSDPSDTNEGELDQKDWEASVELANTLSLLEEEEDSNQNNIKEANDMDSILQVELDGLSQEEEELLGKAAREAVRKYEEEMRQKKSAKLAVQSSWEDANKFTKTQSENKEDGTAVEYEEMTVTELKNILRDRGLKVSGKKSELIERLSSNEGSS
jgi:hypothetical protein